jgi:hypothetical protein
MCGSGSDSGSGSGWSGGGHLEKSVGEGRKSPMKIVRGSSVAAVVVVGGVVGVVDVVDVVVAAATQQLMSTSIAATKRLPSDFEFLRLI